MSNDTTAPESSALHAVAHLGDNTIVIYPYPNPNGVTEGHVWTIRALTDGRCTATNPVQGESHEWTNTKALAMHVAVAFYDADPRRVRVERV